MSPSITIATVCRNAEATLERAVLSVLNQTYPHVEYLIIDGASTDGTLGILERYRDRIRLVSEPDKGVYDAMNKALKLAQGDWLLFLGADDYLLTDTTLAEVVPHLKDPDAVYYGDVYYGSEGNRQFGRVSRLTVMCKLISHQAVFYPRSSYRSLEYDTRYPVAADRVYNITLFSRKIRFRYLDQVISFFSTGGLSSQVTDYVFRHERFRYAWKLGPIPFMIFTAYYLYFHAHHFLHLCKVRVKGLKK